MFYFNHDFIKKEHDSFKIIILFSNNYYRHLAPYNGPTWRHVAAGYNLRFSTVNKNYNNCIRIQSIEIELDFEAKLLTNQIQMKLQFL